MQQPAMDHAAYNAMKDTMGEIFSLVIETFLDYVPQQITRLDAAIKQADCENIFQYAHAIKSSSSSIGALGLANTAEQIEQLGRKNISTGTTQHYQLLQQQFSETVEFLKQNNSIKS